MLRIPRISNLPNLASSWDLKEHVYGICNQYNDNVIVMIILLCAAAGYPTRNKCKPAAVLDCMHVPIQCYHILLLALGRELKEKDFESCIKSTKLNIATLRITLQAES